jgi:ferredoxin-NADP reductase
VPAPPTFDLRLVRARDLSPSARELVFARTDGAPMTFDAGQWVTLVLPLDSGEVRRAYSIASRPDGTPELALAVTRVTEGPGSTYLHGLPIGAELTAIGPQGFFTRTPASPEFALPALFIGTGTGITPLRSLLLDAVANGSASTIHVLCGVRREEDRLYSDELCSLEKTRPQIHAEYTLSKPGDSWQGRRGYVQEHVRELWEALAAKGLGVPHAYICGLDKMVSAVRDLLRKQMGVPRQQVHSERYD